jgi:hypothetical protein
MAKEGAQPNIEVFKKLSTSTIRGEKGWDDSVKGVFPGVKIGVAIDGQEVWSKSVHTHHVGIGGWTTKDMLYGFKVRRATRKANKLVKKLAK